MTAKKLKQMESYKIGPWATLCILTRLQAGECKIALCREHKVSPQTLTRWQRKWGHETAYMHKAASRVILSRELKQGHEALEELRHHIARTAAILEGVVRRHRLHDDVLALYDNPDSPRAPV